MSHAEYLLDRGVPATPEFSHLHEYHKYNSRRTIRSPTDTLPWVWLNRKALNVPRFFPRNKFAINALLSIGGGSLGHLKSAQAFIRCGGSTQDMINYISEYSDYPPQREFARSPSYYAEKLLGPPGLKVLSCDRSLSTVRINFKAHPGGLLRSMGFQRKEETIIVCSNTFKIIYHDWTLTPKSKIQPREVWVTGSRPKLKRIDTLGAALRSGKSLGRVISIASPMEQLLGHPMWSPISAASQAQFFKEVEGIAIGISRFTSDWALIGSQFQDSECVYVGDWSKFDQKIPPWVLQFSLSIIEDRFDGNDTPTANYISNFREFYKNNIIHKDYRVQDVATVAVEGGIPSGSVWTSLLGSIANYVMIHETLESLGFITDEFKIIVYGDDHIILFNEDLDDSFIPTFHNQAEKLFGLRGSTEETYISRQGEFYVTRERPVFAPGAGLSKGTRDLRPRRTETSIGPFESFDHAEGTTHRWNYTFKNRVRFLQFYWDVTLAPLRPLKETITRLVNPEDKVSSVSDHKALLFSHLTDNYWNAHVRNNLYHHMYDLQYIHATFDYKRNTIPLWADLSRSTLARLKHERRRGTPGERMWYRIGNDIAKDIQHPVMSGQNLEWRSMLTIAAEVNTMEKRIGHFTSRSIIKVLFDKGLVSGRKPIGPNDLRNPASRSIFEASDFSHARTLWSEEASEKNAHIQDKVFETCGMVFPWEYHLMICLDPDATNDIISELARVRAFLASGRSHPRVSDDLFLPSPLLSFLLNTFASNDVLNSFDLRARIAMTGYHKAVPPNI